jgi:hypothetical protein
MLVTAASESELENLSRHLLESCYGAKWTIPTPAWAGGGMNCYF